MAMQVLDPNCILDIERSARHLATSVDEMVENLSGLLQGKIENNQQNMFQLNILSVLYAYSMC